MYGAILGDIIGPCQGTVPESVQAFLESESYGDAIRNTISLGGDADTMGPSPAASPGPAMAETA